MPTIVLHNKPLQPRITRAAVAAVTSLICHSFILGASFIYPEATKKSMNTAIEIVLLNSTNNAVVTDAQLFANAALNGGGDVDDGRKTSPLNQSDYEKNGDSLKQQEKKVQLSEQQFNHSILAVDTLSHHIKQVKADVASPRVVDMSDLAIEIARKQAEIDKNIQDYNARPRKYFDGPHTNVHAAAIYVDQWREKVEVWGNDHYPMLAKGKIYGDVVLSVEINKTGKVLLVSVEKSSGHSILDNAAIDSVKKSGPYGAFSKEMLSTIDILVLTRTWVYSNSGLMTHY